MKLAQISQARKKLIRAFSVKLHCVLWLIVILVLAQRVDKVRREEHPCIGFVPSSQRMLRRSRAAASGRRDGRAEEVPEPSGLEVDRRLWGGGLSAGVHPERLKAVQYRELLK